MKNLNGEETLWVILPILLVVGILVASIIILPRTQVEIRGKAAEPTVAPIKVLATPTPSVTQRPEIVCSSLYSPVCSQNGVTYANECEANLEGVTAFSDGACGKPNTTPIKAVSPTPNLLPATN